MIDVSGFGSSVIIIALSSFPVGFSVTEFADDVDPFVVEAIEPTGYEMLYDGSLFAYDKAAAIKVALSVVAGTSDDINLKILLQARKGTAQVLNIPDITSMVVSYPDGGRVMFSNGTIIGGPLADTLQSTGRKKGNTYQFVFGSFAGAQSPIELGSTIVRGAITALGL
jgi:hypothetical protein